MFAPASDAAPVAHPKVTPRIQTDPSICQRELQASRQRWKLSVGALGSWPMKENRTPEEKSQPIEFQEGLMEDRAPRSSRNKQREVALHILGQR